MMKLLRVLAVVMFALSIAGLTGCSYLKSSGSKQGDFDDGVHATGYGDQDGLGEYGISSANRLKAPYNQSYHFGLNKFDVNHEDVESIDVQGNYLVANPKAKVRIEGNCDQRGSREYNIALGWKRAKAVAAFLKQQGVSDSQIAMVSYGKEKPIALGHDEQAHRQNRRVDLIYEAE